MCSVACIYDTKTTVCLFIDVSAIILPFKMSYGDRILRLRIYTVCIYLYKLVSENKSLLH